MQSGYSYSYQDLSSITVAFILSFHLFLVKHLPVGVSHEFRGHLFGFPDDVLLITHNG